jgi:hypothetical protein
MQPSGRFGQVQKVLTKSISEIQRDTVMGREQ